MTARAFTHDDLAIVQQWAGARGMVIPPAFLPQDCVMVEKSGVPVAFAALFFRPAVCAIDHFTTNPDASPESILHAFQALESFASEVARSRGVCILQTFTEARLAPAMSKLGYHVSDTPHVLITKALP